MVGRKSQRKLLEEHAIKRRAASFGLHASILREQLRKDSIQGMADLRERNQLVREGRSGLPKKAGPASGMKSNPKRVNPRSVPHANGLGQRADDDAVRLLAGIRRSLKFYAIA
jgi:hypothetical protein